MEIGECRGREASYKLPMMRSGLAITSSFDRTGFNWKHFRANQIKTRKLSDSPICRTKVVMVEHSIDGIGRIGMASWFIGLD
jgi:hypothetical protein